MKEIMDIIIQIGRIETVQNKETAVKMIGFTGECNSKMFRGEVLPGGVDTQVIGKDGIGTVSARYILKGVDSWGENCSIFIENNGTIDKDGKIHAKPRVVTDSQVFDKIDKDSLESRLEMREDGLHVLILSNEDTV